MSLSINRFTGALGIRRAETQTAAPAQKTAQSQAGTQVKATLLQDATPQIQKTTETATGALRQNQEQVSSNRLTRFIGKILGRGNKTTELPLEIFDQTIHSLTPSPTGPSRAHPPAAARREEEPEVADKKGKGKLQQRQEAKLQKQEEAQQALQPARKAGVSRAAHLGEPGCLAKITPEQRRQIDTYYTANISRWNSHEFQHERLSPKQTGLPFTLDVYKDNGQLHVMVLSGEVTDKDKKAEDRPFGVSSFKRLDVAVDWTSGAVFAAAKVQNEDASLRDNKDAVRDDEGAFKVECEISQRAENHEGIAKAYTGFNIYKASNGRPEATAYMPLYPGATLQSLIHPEGQAIDATTLKNVMTDVMKGLITLREQGVEHHDLRADNIFFTISSEGEAHAHIFDFGVAFRNPRKKGRPIDHVADYKGYGVNGNQGYSSPQKRRALEQRGKRNKEVAKANQMIKDLKTQLFPKQYKAFVADQKAALTLLSRNVAAYIDETSPKNDTWAAGMTLLALLEGSETGTVEAIGTALDDREITQLYKAGHPELYEHPEHPNDPLHSDNYPLFQGIVDGHLDELESRLTDPGKIAMLGLIRGMLRVDHNERVTPEQVLERLSPPVA